MPRSTFCLLIVLLAAAGLLAPGKRSASQEFDAGPEPNGYRQLAQAPYPSTGGYAPAGPPPGSRFSSPENYVPITDYAPPSSGGISAPRGDAPQWNPPPAAGPPPGAQPPWQPGPAAPPAVPDMRLMEAARVVAIVGNQYILAGDVMGAIKQALDPYVGQVPEDQLDQQRQILLQQFVKQTVETKMMYLDFVRSIPPGKMPEIEGKINEQFDKFQLDVLMKNAKVNTPAELDAKLRDYGSSLLKQRRAFAEKVLGREMVKRHVDYEVEVTHDEMLAYYREHSADYEVRARARWEQLSARFDSQPSKADAYRAVAEMGNRVLRGAPLAEVAKQDSQGPTASNGGQYDWTTKGGLRSTVLDEAIFSLPLDRLSQILEDDDGFHIIRVLEREEAGRISFVEAQVKIKEEIRKEKINKQIADYVTRLREQTYVWTVFDDPNSAGRTGQMPGSPAGR